MTAPQHNYLAQIHQMWKAGALPREAGYHHIAVYHDEWCGSFQGQRCDCNPDIRLKGSQPAAAQN